MNGLGFAAVRDWNAFLRYETARRLRQRQPAGRRHQAHLHRDLVAARTPAERLPPPRLQRGRERQEGVRRPHAVDRRRQRHQHELPLLAARPHRAQPPGPPLPRRPLPVRQRDDAPTRSPARPTAATRAARQTNTCPLAMEIYSANEYWVKAASLLHTDPTGTARPAGFAVRAQLPHVEHAARHRQRAAQPQGSCQQFQNPLNSAPVQRALFIALDEWSTTASQPPESRVPQLPTARWCRRCRSPGSASRTSRA